LLAIIILIIPADKWAQDYRDLAFQWGLVKQKVDGVETSATDDVKLAAIKEIKTQAGSIREPSIWRTLLVQCYGDQNERIYGLGRRSYDQVVEYLKSIGVQVPTPPPVPPPGAPGKPNEDAQASRNLQPS
jgi:hypothetical protein